MCGSVPEWSENGTDGEEQRRNEHMWREVYRFFDHFYEVLKPTEYVTRRKTTVAYYILSRSILC